MIVALFDSGVDYRHEVFGSGRQIPFRDAAGLPYETFRPIFESAVAGRLGQHDLEHFAECASQAVTYTGNLARILPCRDFAGHHPGMDLSEQGTSTTNIFDFNGHGTASAGILVQNGLTVLPIKVGYSLAPEISLGGLVAGCEWLLNERLAGLECDIAVWTFGMPGNEEAEYFSQLIAELNKYGVKVHASGRGVFQNICSPTEFQSPSDLETVCGVDEFLVLQRYSLLIDGELHIAYRLPGTPAPPRGRLTVTTTPLERNEQLKYLHICEESGVRENIGVINSHADLAIIESGARPYVTAPDPYLFRVPVLVTTEPLRLSPGSRAALSISKLAEHTAKPQTLSPGRQVFGQTGMAVAAAHTYSGWTAAFGSSIAAPSSVRI